MVDKKAAVWAVVLAGGEGTRLHSLTTSPSGVAVPKQYCSLRGGPSLVQQTLQRALTLAPMPRVCTIVAAQHRVWRDAQLRHWLDDNVIEQPENRGTAHGVLLALFHVLLRDPDADIILFPADHFVADEAVFRRTLERVIDCVASNRNDVFLLGVRPDETDTELGYIVPEYRDSCQPSRVVEFIEKPDSAAACALVTRGALWNTFILAASARVLLSLFGTSFESTRRGMLHAVEQDNAIRMTDLYRSLPSLDFSRAVLEGQETRLRVLPVPDCGWTDLGTPTRVARALERAPHPTGATALISDAVLGLDLAAQQWRLEFYRNRSPYFGIEPLPMA